MPGNWNNIDSEQTNTLRFANSSPFGIGHFLFRNRHAFAQNPLLFFRRLFHRERKQRFQLREK